MCNYRSAYIATLADLIDSARIEMNSWARIIANVVDRAAAQHIQLSPASGDDYALTCYREARQRYAFAYAMYCLERHGCFPARVS